MRLTMRDNSNVTFILLPWLGINSYGSPDIKDYNSFVELSD